MVRNTSGGSKTKSFARKNISSSHESFSFSSSLERHAFVSKLFGNGMCQIITYDPSPLSLLCHIRGKFKGKLKKHNSVQVNSQVVVGLREWESPYKNCDLLFVYPTFADSDINDSKKASTLENFSFSNDDPIPDYEPDEQKPSATESSSSSAFINTEDGDIDIDDI